MSYLGLHLGLFKGQTLVWAELGFHVFQTHFLQVKIKEFRIDVLMKNLILWAGLVLWLGPLIIHLLRTATSGQQTGPRCVATTEWEPNSVFLNNRWPDVTPFYSRKVPLSVCVWVFVGARQILESTVTPKGLILQAFCFSSPLCLSRIWVKNMLKFGEKLMTSHFTLLLIVLKCAYGHQNFFY